MSQAPAVEADEREARCIGRPRGIAIVGGVLGHSCRRAAGAVRDIDVGLADVSPGAGRIEKARRVPSGLIDGSVSFRGRRHRDEAHGRR